MNDERRKKLKSIRDQLSNLEQELQELKDSESDAFDNLPQGLQAADRGQQMETYRDALEEAAESVASAISSIDDNGLLK